MNQITRKIFKYDHGEHTNEDEHDKEKKKSKKNEIE